MLSKEEFSKKYGTTLEQLHEESFLEEVSEEDREIYDDVEILTGKDSKGLLINKFNNFGKRNKGKKYNTVRGRAIASFKKFIDKKITAGELDDQWERIWKSSKGGNFNFSKMLMERMLGKEEEKVAIKNEGEITFTLDLDNNSIERKKENLEKKDN